VARVGPARFVVERHRPRHVRVGRQAKLTT
jgi:hypothetical protein